MNTFYEDILSRIVQPPEWFDEHAVPRYCTFNPKEIADIYADECCLLRIRCQSCRKEFQVALSWQELSGGPPLSNGIDEFDYGEPPNVNCCDSGTSMCSEARQVLEFWKRGKYEWIRCPELEIMISKED